MNKHEAIQVLKICASTTSILHDGGYLQTTWLSRSTSSKKSAASISRKLKCCASPSWRSRRRSERRHETRSPPHA